jgi:hypothetical protein
MKRGSVLNVLKQVSGTQVIDRPMPIVGMVSTTVSIVTVSIVTVSIVTVPVVTMPIVTMSIVSMSIRPGFTFRVFVRFVQIRVVGSFRLRVRRTRPGCIMFFFFAKNHFFIRRKGFDYRLPSTLREDTSSTTGAPVSEIRQVERLVIETSLNKPTR